MFLIRSCYLLLNINTSKDYFWYCGFVESDGNALLMLLYLKGDDFQASTDWI